MFRNHGLKDTLFAEDVAMVSVPLLTASAEVVLVLVLVLTETLSVVTDLVGIGA